MSAEHAHKRAVALGRRICDAELVLPPSAQELWQSLKNALLGAARNERVVTPAFKIGELIKLQRGSQPDRGRTFAVLGGRKDFKRQDDDGWFRRDDGALFNFTITVIERRPALELVAYDFELRPPPGMVPTFVRFDLNAPLHANEEAGLRCHVHPGHDDLAAPSALMTPLELLELFIYRMRLPDRMRSAT